MNKYNGGGRFGKVWNSWPFVTLTIDTDNIMLTSILQKKVVLKRNCIQEIILQEDLINYRFIFKHNDPEITKDIEFWSFSLKPVINDLRSYDYPVSDSS